MDLWPKACKSQGWNRNDREFRLKVLSIALKRKIESASEIQTKGEFDSIIAYLGFASDDIDKTTETDHPEIGSARRKRKKIEEQLKCLGVYHPSPYGYLNKIIRDKFGRVGLDDLTDALIVGDDGREHPSQLDQVLYALGRGIQSRRTAAKDSIHDMLLKAGLPCYCVRCKLSKRKVTTSPARFVAGGGDIVDTTATGSNVEKPVTSSDPF